MAKGAEPPSIGDNDKPTVIALREIAERKVDQAMIDEIDKPGAREGSARRWSGPPPKSTTTSRKGGDDL